MDRLRDLPYLEAIKRSKERKKINDKVSSDEKSCYFLIGYSAFILSDHR